MLCRGWNQMLAILKWHHYPDQIQLPSLLKTNQPAAHRNRKSVCFKRKFFLNLTPHNGLASADVQTCYVSNGCLWLETEAWISNLILFLGIMAFLHLLSVFHCFLFNGCLMIQKKTQLTVFHFFHLYICFVSNILVSVKIFNICYVLFSITASVSDG